MHTLSGPRGRGWQAASLRVAWGVGALLAWALSVPIAQAQGSGAESHRVPPAAREELWVTVADADLDRLRGGFDVGGGLIVSLGIQQATYINGLLVTQTSIPLTQLSQLTANQAAILRERLQTLTVVQNGPGNRWGNIQSPVDGSALVSHVAGAGPGTVVQNSLNGQQIQNLTTIDATSNAMGLLKAGNWQQSLRDSMGAVGGLR